MVFCWHVLHILYSPAKIISPKGKSAENPVTVPTALSTKSKPLASPFRLWPKYPSSETLFQPCVLFKSGLSVLDSFQSLRCTVLSPLGLLHMPFPHLKCCPLFSSFHPWPFWTMTGADEKEYKSNLRGLMLPDAWKLWWCHFQNKILPLLWLQDPKPNF